MEFVETSATAGRPVFERHDREAVWARARAGDRRALSRVLAELQPVILPTARKVLGERYGAEVEDVVQDSLLAVAKALATIESRKALPAYARRTTVRVAMRARRRREREAPFDPAPARSLEMDVRRRRQADALLAVLDEIPAAQAEALIHRVVIGLSLAETAETLGAPQNTIRSRLRSAKLALRAKIIERPELHELLGVGHG